MRWTLHRLAAACFGPYTGGRPRALDPTQEVGGPMHWTLHRMTAVCIGPYARGWWPRALDPTQKVGRVHWTLHRLVTPCVWTLRKRSAVACIGPYMGWRPHALDNQYSGAAASSHLALSGGGGCPATFRAPGAAERSRPELAGGDPAAVITCCAAALQSKWIRAPSAPRRKRSVDCPPRAHIRFLHCGVNVT